MNEQNEMLDLVNEHDQVIGVIDRASVEYYHQRYYTRVINAFIMNSTGQLWIPRRCTTKRFHPGGLDMSVGGHVASGETYDQAFARELGEELNMKAEEYKVELLGHLNPIKDKVSAFMNVYLIHSDVCPDYNPNEFCESFWLKPQEVLERVERGEPAKWDLARLITIFFKKDMVK